MNNQLTHNTVYNSSKYRRTEFIQKESDKHKELIKHAREEGSNLLAKLLEKCDIEVLNNEIIVLRFASKTIYSEQAEAYKTELTDLFNALVNKKIEVVPYVVTLKHPRMEAK